jgi:hypothetical protein
LSHLLICQSAPKVLEVVVGLAGAHGDLSVIQTDKDLRNAG